MNSKVNLRKIKALRLGLFLLAIALVGVLVGGSLGLGAETNRTSGAALASKGQPHLSPGSHQSAIVGLAAKEHESLKWVPVKPLDPAILYSGPSTLNPSVLRSPLASTSGSGALAAQVAPSGLQNQANSTSTASGSGSTGANGQGAVALSSLKANIPAPPGFKNELLTMYSDAIKVGATTASFPQAPPVSTLKSSLNGLNSVELSLVYDAFQKSPGGVSGLLSDFGQMVVGLPSSSTLGSVGLIAHQSPGTGISFTGVTTETTDSAGNASNCPPGVPGGNYGQNAIYAATLAVDVAITADAVVPQSLVLGAYVLGEGATFTIPDPVNIVVQTLIGAAEIARDTLIWQAAINSDCTAGAQQEQIGIIFDNINSLIQLVDSRTTAIDNEEQLLYALVDSRNTLILNKIGALQASLNLELKVTIEEDLLQGAKGAISSVEVPAVDGGYLNATPIGVQSLVTQALASEQAAGQAINPSAPSTLASANTALAAGQYKQAFNLYAQAYQEIVA